MTDTAKQVNRAEEALTEVDARFGSDGVRAVAAFMHAMGSEATLNWADAAGEEKWSPCDFVMQHAWELGGTPVASSGRKTPRWVLEEDLRRMRSDPQRFIIGMGINGYQQALHGVRTKLANMGVEAVDGVSIADEIMPAPTEASPG